MRTNALKLRLCALSIGFLMVWNWAFGGEFSQTDLGKVTRESPVPLLRDGFEGNAPADFWLPGDYGSGLYVPGAIKITTNYARSGARSVQITVHERDVQARGDSHTWVERAELDSG